MIIDDRWVCRNRSVFHGYQNAMVEKRRVRRRFAVWAEMGLGKTAIGATIARDLLAAGDAHRFLITGPLKVVNKTWLTELEEWAHLRRLSLNIATGDEKSRRRAIDTPSNLLAINVDNFRWMVQQYRKKWPCDGWIVDESGLFRNPGSRRFAAAKSIESKFDYVVQLTGSPSPRGLLNIWSQVYLLDRGTRLGTSYEAFKERYFYPDRSGYGWNIKPFAADEIFEKIADICFSLRAEDWLEMPEVRPIPITVDLPRKVRAVYDDMELDYLATVNSVGIEAANSGVKWMKLSQMANGFIYDEDKVAHPLHDEKLDALSDLFDEATGSPLLVAYKFTEDRDRIAKAFGRWATIADKNGDFLEDWNQGRIPLLIMPASGSFGLNMQKGRGHRVAWFGRPPALDDYEQLLARIARQGQRRTVLEYTITARDTVDEDIVANHISRNDNQNRLKNATKLRIEKRLKR